MKYDTELKVIFERILITEVTYLLSVRLASFRWQELYSGLFTELGKLHTNATLQLGYRLEDSLVVKGKCAIPHLRERQNTDVVCRGRLTRSSVEIFVMKMEQRG